MKEKIAESHLARKAILYVRQSSTQQVVNNEESRRLQYAMTSRLKEMGWDRVDVFDEDLGKSASGAVDRSGFERMVAEVCLGDVGVVAAREVSRFARNSRDWQQLIEVCRMVDTLLVDQEMVYDPRRGNDRLLLGLKGSMNEYELDILRLRSLEARREKARRGELISIVPAGYVKADDGRLAKDPDRRVQEALSLVFQKFLALGSARQTLLWFVEEGLELPVRRHRAGRWEVDWVRPAYHTILGILKNPIYAGVYAFGKTSVHMEYRDGVPRKRVKSKPIEEWLACIYDHHEGYINRGVFQRIQEMISKNCGQRSSTEFGAARQGQALLAGLLRCRRCARKLTVAYSGCSGEIHRYSCQRSATERGDPKCISFGGSAVDQAISREVLRVVSPGAVEAAKKVAEEGLEHHDDVVRSLSLAVDEARFAAERARRQYDAVDPENRLVAEELERRWNLALEKLHELEQRLEQKTALRGSSPASYSESLEDLASDFAQVWEHPSTDVRLKKRLLRTVIEELVVDVDSKAGVVSLVVHWKGGVHTEINVRKRRRGWNPNHTPPEAVTAMEVLSRICTDEMIAGWLSRNGLVTGYGLPWTAERVKSMRLKRRISCYSKERQEDEGWMNLKDAAAYVKLAPGSLRAAVERGDIQATHPLPEGPWVFERDHLDEAASRRALQRIRRRYQESESQAPGQLSLFDSTLCGGDAV